MSETYNGETYQNNSSGGGCGKVLLWLFLIALILSCLCCAGFIGTSYYIANSLKNGFVEDPVVAEEKTVEAFGELNLPENIKPRAFLSVNLFGRDFGFASIYSWKLAQNELTAASAESESVAQESALPSDESLPKEVPAETSADDEENNNGVIVFYLLSDVLKGQEKEVVDQISQKLTKQNNGNNITVKRSETIPITIKGEPCEFTFSWMEEDRSVNKNTFLMVSGNFKSTKETPCNVFIALPGEPEKETVIKVLENIQK